MSDYDRLRFSLLGPVEAHDGAGALNLGGPRQRALLALLLLEPGRPVATGRLVEELWRGSPPPGAGNTLYSYVSRLRRAIGRDRVVARAGGYALAVDPAAVDVRRFEELHRLGSGARERGAAGAASEHLGAALALWRGRALADVADGSDALASEARRLEELRLVCLERRHEADLALGRDELLVPELRALTAAEPLREVFWRQLVLALYRCGQQAEALAAFREAREKLDELGLEPGEELRQAERAVLRQEVAVVEPAQTRHNLPAPTTSFVGRERELDELQQLLREHRLVTVTGMGGSGKTRLALETSRRLLGAWSDGTWLVDLTALADPALVLPAVAAAVGAPEPTPASLLAHTARLELLLVLDNCEHVVSACAELAESLLPSCPNLRILATSRVPLAVPGEADFALRPLPEAPAVQLFLERSRAVRRDLPDTEDAADTAAAICRDLDGLPLAIELAAARAKALSLGEIAERLDNRFRFLRAWQRVADPRHQTLQTTMDWSYELLEPEERQLLDRLAVFAGGAELDAAAEICLDGDEAGAVELLGRLVAASLVVAETGERTRYRLLETVRRYATEKLAADPEAEWIRRRHGEFFFRLAESANLSIDSIGRGPQNIERVLREQHNLRAALDWAALADVELGLRVMLALENFWVTHSLVEGARRYEELLARADDLDLVLRARATRDFAACFDVLEELDRAERLYEESGRLAREAGDESGVATAVFRAGVIAAMRGDYDEARALWLKSLTGFQAAGDRIGVL